MLAFQPQLAKIETQERSNRDSARLSELDQERDILFNVIRDVAKRFHRISLEPFNAAASEIMTLLKKHGNAIAAANYTAETKRLYDLSADIDRSPAVQSALATLSLYPLFERLKEANREFDQLFMQRNQSRATVEKIDIRAIRLECDKAITAFWIAVDYCVAEYGKTAYKVLIEEMNHLNTYYKQQLAARATRRKAKADVSKDEPIQVDQS